MKPYQLYWRTGSGSMVVEAALLLAGVDYVLINVPTKEEQRDLKFRTLNPAGMIPVLVTPDGQTIIESMAILLSLDERHKHAELLPAYATPQRAFALQWLAFMATSTYASALRFYYAHRFTSEKTPEAIAAVKAAGAEALDRDFKILCDALEGPFFLGQKLCIADVYLAMIADWHEPSQLLPKIQNLKTVLLKNSAIKMAWDNHEFAP